MTWLVDLSPKRTWDRSEGYGLVKTALSSHEPETTTERDPGTLAIPADSAVVPIAYVSSGTAVASVSMEPGYWSP